MIYSHKTGVPRWRGLGVVSHKIGDIYLARHITSLFISLQRETRGGNHLKWLTIWIKDKFSEKLS